MGEMRFYLIYIISQGTLLQGVIEGASALSFLPPSLHQSPREGGQGDRSHISNKLQTPRGRDWVGKDAHGEWWQAGNSSPEFSKKK